MAGSYLKDFNTAAFSAGITALDRYAFGALPLKLPFGALAALAVAATPFSVLDITSGFWALPAGIFASLINRILA